MCLRACEMGKLRRSNGAFSIDARGVAELEEVDDPAWPDEDDQGSPGYVADLIRGSTDMFAMYCLLTGAS